MQFCPYCGVTLVEDAAAFCPECGKPLKLPAEGSHPKTAVGSVERKTRNSQSTLAAHKKKESAPARSEPVRKPPYSPKTHNKRPPPKKKPVPPAKPKSDKRIKTNSERSPAPNPADENYDGYYDDVPTDDNGQDGDRLEPELIKRIVLIAGGTVVIVVLAVLIMYLL